MDIPVIETERLLLRGMTQGDFEAQAEMWADPVVTRFIGGVPLSREQAWIRHLRHIGSWQVMGFGFWAVIDKATNRLIGEAGFHDLKRDLTPSIEGTLETGWGFVPDAHGKGVATETVSAVLAWGDAQRPAMRMTCLIDPGNTASIRVAEKHGFREFARSTYHGAPTILFERLRPA
ncbi:GNAT family N-acetyltransferase [Mesorhizobium australicum]|uniref:Protein N-acetyltransferase, RimJ/RimL family n=1 Tax=Mesorhizobium australicum TaxID=536018 RepID=A0A1X7NBT5_9HYPH|nr:GNAT family N-acetyltransferase [Mesorhizobium australicum]SMH34305.1 Protein N-acetyltransferase, RimJ/RimL family [Mesorhizobium australicum]